METLKRNEEEGYSESEEYFSDIDDDDRKMVVKLDGILKDINN